MAFTGKLVIRVVFAVCIVLIFLSDYSGLVDKLLGNNASETNTSNRPRPKNPGYGDTKAEIDLDADIEDDTIKNIGPPATKLQILTTIKNACLPKLICELNATPEKEKLSDSEKSLLSLISLSTKENEKKKFPSEESAERHSAWAFRPRNKPEIKKDMDRSPTASLYSFKVLNKEEKSYIRDLIDKTLLWRGVTGEEVVTAAYSCFGLLDPIGIRAPLQIPRSPL